MTDLDKGAAGHRWSRRFDGPNPVDILGPERRPDFFCIGTEKAGTTWLWHSAMAHPGIGVPAVKELRFFNQSRAVDFAHFRALRRLLEHPSEVPLRHQFLERIATEVRLFYGGVPAYLRVFGQMSQPVVGELTPQYCIQPPDRIQEMKDIAPEARIVYMLRDPVDRILSGARMALTARGIPLTDDNLGREARHPIQQALSNAAEHLDGYEAVFGTEAVRCFFFEDVAERPAGLFAAFCDFLGADPQAVPNEILTDKVNAGVAHSASAALRANLYRTLSPVYDALERRFPDRVGTWRKRHEDAA